MKEKIGPKNPYDGYAWNEQGLKYYSFVLGGIDAMKKYWILDDVKMPALNVRGAILLHHIHFTFRGFSLSRYPAFKKMEFKTPNKHSVNFLYKKVIEYERKYTPRRGYTTHTYKKLNEFLPHHFIDYFPD